jgi:hypothetical protein
VSLSLLVTPALDRCTPPLHLAASTAVRHTSFDLAGQLNREWAALVTAPATAPALTQWPRACPELTGVSTLGDVLALVARSVPPDRDAVLLALVERAQAGDALAGRTVLQAMLGKAVRVAGTVARRDDVRGDREEALARAVAALWQALAPCPGRGEPRTGHGRLAQRGHTGSSHFRLSYREVPVADVGNVGPVGRHDRDPGDLRGPADAELLTLLAWAVRHRVVALGEAQLLLRVYTVDGRPAVARTVAEQTGLTWPTLRHVAGGSPSASAQPRSGPASDVASTWPPTGCRRHDPTGLCRGRSGRASTGHAVAVECQLAAGAVRVAKGKTRRCVVGARGGSPFFVQNLRKRTVLSTDMSFV